LLFPSVAWVAISSVFSPLACNAFRGNHLDASSTTNSTAEDGLELQQIGSAYYGTDVGKGGHEQTKTLTRMHLYSPNHDLHH
jgi:hypothetical protein